MIQALTGIIPGRIGFLLRRLFYSLNFSNTGKKNSYGKFLEIENPKHISLGNRCSIGDFSFFSASNGKIIVGDEVSFNRNVHLNASIGGNIKIESYCLIGPNVVMLTSNHNFCSKDIPIRKQGHTFSDIHLEEDVWLGANVIILPNVKIGKGSVIAAGSVVTKDIPSYSVATGIPARVIKKR